MTVEVVDAPRTSNGVTIENVSVSAENATGAVVTIAATRSGGVWTATLPASHFAAVGVVAMGVTISASGTDENGAARSWIIGKGDLTILPADGVPVPGETLQNVHMRDSVPATPLKGDLCEGASGWQIYTGEAWAEIGGNAPEPSTSAPLMDGTASAGSSAAYARGDHRHPTDTSRMAATATGADIAVSSTDATKISAALAGKATKADATLTERGFTAWEVTPATFQGQPIEIRWVDATQYGYPGYSWEPFAGSQMLGGAYNDNENATTFYCESTIAEVGGPISATRTALQGYKLGSQTDKPLAAEAEAEALRQGKQDALSAQQLANIAAVPNKANTADLPYSQTATTGGSFIVLSARSGNRYDLSAVTGAVVLALPTVESGKCADVVCTIVTGATVPTLSFPSGVVFIAADSDWATLAASSYNVFSFTSTGAPNEWIVGRITSALPTA